MNKSTQIEVKFDFTLDKLEGMGKSDSLFFVAWSVSRGIKQARAGETKKVLLSASGSAVLNHSFSLSVGMHQKGRFESKLMKIAVKEEGKKSKAKTSYKLVIDLADLAEFTKGFEEKVYNLQGGKLKPPPTLGLHVKASYTKIDGKAVTISAGARSDGTQREAVEVGGQLLFLATDQDLSDENSADDTNPFGSDGASTAGAPSSPASSSALFKRMDPVQENAQSASTPPAADALFRQAGGVAAVPGISSTMQVLEESKRVGASKGKEESTSGGALFRQSKGSHEPKPGALPMSSTMQVLEAAHRSEAASAPKGAPPSSSATVASEKKTNPFADASNPFADEPTTPPRAKVSEQQSEQALSYKVLSPSSEELQMLRKQNRLLTETLDKQERKIDQLREKMAEKTPPPTTSVVSASDAKLRERELELEQSLRKLKEAEQSLSKTEGLLEKERAKVTSLEAVVAAEKKRSDKVSSADIARVTQLEKDLLSERSLSEDLTAQVAALKKQLAQSAKAVPVSKSEERIAEKDREIEKLNRELSRQQLAMIEISNRLREAEASASESTSKKSQHKDSLDEVNSLQMQLVAMEQDYESQLEELRAELEELKEQQQQQQQEDEADSAARAKSDAAAKDAVIETLRNKIVSLKKKISDLQSKNSLSPGKNPLMAGSAVVAASPFSNEDFEKLTSRMNVLSTVNDCVWAVPIKYDDQGQALAARMILAAVKDDPGDLSSSMLHERIESAIQTAATNQLSLEGRMYWLNVTTHLLHDLSKQLVSAKVPSPRDAGIDVGVSTAPSLSQRQGGTVRDLMVVFADRMARLSLHLYKLCVNQVLGQVLPLIEDAVFVSSLNSEIGARINAAASEMTMIVDFMDVALRATMAAHLFPVVTRQLFQQVFHSIGATLFNLLLKRTDLSASRSIAIKLQLAQLEHWPSPDNVDSGVKKLLRNVPDQGLAPVKEVCNLLLIDKGIFVQRSALTEMAPSLNARQVKSFLTAFVPDEMCPERTPIEVLDRLTQEIRKTDSLQLDPEVWLASKP